jgi:hypothetical protein
MNPRPPTPLLALAVLLAALGPRRALAAEQGCAAMVVEPDAGFRARFPDLLTRIHELAARTDIDACAHVTLHFGNDIDIDVSVTLPDGRIASRVVSRREDVMPTLQALLLVPDEPPPVSAPAPSTVAKAKRAERQPGRVEPARPSARDVPATPAPVPRELGFELSAISGVRVGDGQFGYGAGVLSFLQVHSWLVGFEGRADGYRSIYGSDPETALELAILGGRRFDFGSVALDFTAGPGLAMKGVTFSDIQSVEVTSMPQSMPPSRPPRRDEPSSGPVPRLLVGARLGFSPRSIFRTFVGIDGEVGPSRSSADPKASVSSPRMPTFTVGLALGATVGTP